MKTVILYFFGFIAGMYVLILFLSMANNHFAFRYLFQVLTSFSILIVVIYYLSNKQIKLAPGLFLLSVVTSNIRELLLNFTTDQQGNPFSLSPFNDFLTEFLNKYVFIKGRTSRIWMIPMSFIPFTNSLVLVRVSERVEYKITGPVIYQYSPFLKNKI